MPIEDLEVTIIEQMRNTQIDTVPADHNTVFDEYDMGPMQDDFGADYDDSNHMTQDLMQMEPTEADPIKEGQNDDNQNYTNIFERNFDFWNYMEPEKWQMSMLIRKGTHSKVNHQGRQQEEIEVCRVRRGTTPVNQGAGDR